MVAGAGVGNAFIVKIFADWIHFNSLSEEFELNS
jgi:hypothetical protein